MMAMALAVLLLSPISAMAAACLSIDVPPQAVIAQPDGDTFHLFSFTPGGKVKIRVQDTRTPERNEPGFAEASAFTKSWLSQGPFTVSTCGKPTLDRIVATVERNGRSLAQDLVSAGHSR